MANKENILKIAKEKKINILLKGSTDLFVDCFGKYFENKIHHPIMTRGGTGDMLAALCAGLRCKFSYFKAVNLAVKLIGKAGICAYKSNGFLTSGKDIFLKLRE